MTPTCEPIVFENRRGLRLFGIVHNPQADVRSEVAVVLLSPGIKSRVAPHRLYNKLAEMMAAAGFMVFRFDFCGLGDSEGVIDERSLADLYGSIQVGRFVEDTTAAIDWIAAQYGYSRFIVGGLCGGALTGVLAAHRDARVAGVLGLGLPVMLQGTGLDYRRYMTTGQLNTLGHAYLRKVFRPGAWVRLLTLRTDYRLLARVVSNRLRRKAPTPRAGASDEQADNTNPLFPPAFESLLARGGRALLVFGESDRLRWEFEEKYSRRYRAVLDRYAAQVSIQSVPSANHVLTFSEWQHEMIERSQDWLVSHFGISHGAQPRDPQRAHHPRPSTAPPALSEGRL